MPPIASIISLVLVELPQVGDLIAKMIAEGRTQPTAQELSDLGVADSDFAAAYGRVYPGQTPPTV